MSTVLPTSRRPARRRPVRPGQVRPGRVRPRQVRAGSLRPGELLGLAGGLLGAACLLATLVAAALGGSVLVVRTGSMQPRLPVGSVLLVRPVAVTAVAPGEVVGSRRPDGRVLVHRVVRVDPATGPAGTRTLVTRGDANPVADPPLVTATVLRPLAVVASPWPGHVVTVLRARWAQFWLGVLAGAVAVRQWGAGPARRRRRAGG